MIIECDESHRYVNVIIDSIERTKSISNICTKRWFILSAQTVAKNNILSDSYLTKR